MLLRAILSGGVWNGFLLGWAKKEDVPCRFCGGRDGDGQFGVCLSLLPSCGWIGAGGLGVYYGMAGCLVVRIIAIAGLRLLVSLLFAG